MKILIPSRSRPNAQITANQLYDAGLPFTIVRTFADETLYPDHFDQIRAPVDDIQNKRNWILEQHAGQKIIVCDDDVTFFRVWDGVALPATPEDLRLMFDRLDSALDKYAHAGVASRFMIHSQPRPHVLNSRILHIHGFNLEKFPDPPPRYRMKTCSDIDFNMQLLASGRACLVLTDFCHQDGKYMAPGGCADWRTDAMILAGHRELKRLWPDYVKLREGADKPGGVLATIYFKKLAKDHGCEQ